jgi:hypothetical protein
MVGRQGHGITDTARKTNARRTNFRGSSNCALGVRTRLSAFSTADPYTEHPYVSRQGCSRQYTLDIFLYLPGE